MPKQRLHIDKNDKDYIALGINTILPGYRLAYMINRNLEMEFIMAEDIPLLADGHIQNIEAFVYNYDAHNIYIAKNRRENFSILPAIKQADFLLFAKGSRYQEVIEHFRKKLHTISNIQSTFAIPSAYLKNIEID